MNSIIIRKVDSNLKNIIRDAVKTGTLINFDVQDFGKYVKIICAACIFYVSKIDYLKMMTEILEVKVKAKVKH